MKVVQIINEVGINDKCGGYLRLIPLVLLLVPPTLLLVPPGGTSVFQWYRVASRCFEKFTPCPNTSHPALVTVIIISDDRSVNDYFSQFSKRAMALLSFVDVDYFLFLWKDKRMSRE